MSTPRQSPLPPSPLAEKHARHPRSARPNDPRRRLLGPPAGLLSLLLPLVVAGFAACSDDGGADPGVDGGEDCTPEVTFAEPLSPGPPEALLIVPQDLAGDFQRLANFHRQTGVQTQLVTLAGVCAATQSACDDTDPRQDTARAIKDYIIQVRADATALRYVVLGGDLERVPSRLTHDHYESVLGDVYDEEFYSDYYFSDLSEWDTDGDGEYGEIAEDTPDYRPEVSVSRIPVSTAVETRRYIDKVIRYCARFEPSHVSRALLVANLAMEIMGTPVSSARYLEAAGRTVDLLPPAFVPQKLYNAADPVDPQARDVTVHNQINALQAGVSMVIHAGHASPDLLTTEAFWDEDYAFYGHLAYTLDNSTLPIFLSGGCQAGQFEAPVQRPGQPYDEDAAGERLVNAPDGGAVAYLGNTIIGLGLAGGSQLIDEMVVEMGQRETLRLADAFLAAHQRLPETDTFDFPIGGEMQVVNPDSYRWTQKAAVILGDGLVPVWNAEREPAPAITATRTDLCGGVRLEVTVSDPTVPRLYVSAGDRVYKLPLEQGAGSIHIPDPVTDLSVGAAAESTFFLYQSVP